MDKHALQWWISQVFGAHTRVVSSVHKLHIIKAAIIETEHTT